MGGHATQVLHAFRESHTLSSHPHDACFMAVRVWLQGVVSHTLCLLAAWRLDARCCAMTLASLAGRCFSLSTLFVGSIHLVTGVDLVQHQQDVAVGLASLRAHLAVIFFLFLVLYEAAVILSNMPTGLSAPVSGLTDMELCRWTVFGGGAREKLLLNMVNRGRSSGRLATPQSRTWSTCRSVSECLQQVVTAESVNNPLCALAPIRHVEVGLSWKTTVISEFRQNPYLCNLLEVMDAEDEFYTFGMGWFFADVNFSAPNATAHLATWAQRRQEVNAAIRRGRETHAISRVIGREVGFALPCNSPAKLALAESLYVTVVVLLVSGAISALALFRVYQPVDDAVTAAAEATTETDVEE